MRIQILLPCALLGLNVTHAAPSCQELADKVNQEFAAEQKMIDVDGQVKCRAITQVIAHLTDIAAACGADKKFIETTYLPLANKVAEEGPKACHR